MPRHANDLRNGGALPVKPQTNEYKLLSFLVRNRDYAFTLDQIAHKVDVDESSVPETLSRLLEKGLIEQTEDLYYLGPGRADTLKRQLDSIDAAARLFEAAPRDDAYAEEGWENSLPSIDPNQSTSEQDQVTSQPRDTHEGAAALIGQISDERESENRE